MLKLNLTLVEKWKQIDADPDIPVELKREVKLAVLQQMIQRNENIVEEK